jgi:hypothetical protein
VWHPITAACFAPSGRLFAYAFGYDWSQGSEYRQPVPNAILIHRVTDNEIRPRARR